MCNFSKKDALKHAKNGKEFRIERNITDLNELANHMKKVKDNNGKKR